MFRKCQISILNTWNWFLSTLSSLVLFCEEFLFSNVYVNLIYNAIHSWNNLQFRHFIFVKHWEPYFFLCNNFLRDEFRTHIFTKLNQPDCRKTTLSWRENTLKRIWTWNLIKWQSWKVISRHTTILFSSTTAQVVVSSFWQGYWC